MSDPAKAFASTPGGEACPMDLPLGKAVTVLRHFPGGAILLEKPKGVLTHPNHARDVERSLLTAAYDGEQEAYLWVEPETGKPRRLYLCHRLDEPTSGLLLGADNPVMARRIREAFARKQVHKTYRAFLFGRIPLNSFNWRDGLRKAQTPQGPRMQIHRAGNPAETRGTVLNRYTSPFGNITEVQFHPVTGRTHQLRVQSASRGFPIIGDTLYGDFARNRRLSAGDNSLDRLFLHAEALSLSIGGKQSDATLSIEERIALPPAFAMLQKQLQGGTSQQ